MAGTKIDEEKPAVPREAQGDDEDEIDLPEDDDDDDEQNENKGDDNNVHKADVSKENDDTDSAKQPSSEPAPEQEPTKTSSSKKSDALKARMQALKLKMNQARQLNRQEVLREGERLGSMEGAHKARQQQKQRDKRLQKEEWESRHATALQVASQAGIDGKHLVEQADASLQKARKKSEAADASMFSPRDYHNPEGQHRNYQKNLKALTRAGAPTAADTEGTFDPTAAFANTDNEARERDGARRLSQEMLRRIDKQEKKKRDRVEFEETDVSYINLRNKRFNEKINRNFDKHTAEIRQNLERGTAL